MKSERRNQDNWTGRSFSGGTWCVRNRPKLPLSKLIFGRRWSTHHRMLSSSPFGVPLGTRSLYDTQYILRHSKRLYPIPNSIFWASSKAIVIFRAVWMRTSAWGYLAIEWYVAKGIHGCNLYDQIPSVLLLTYISYTAHAVQYAHVLIWGWN